MGMYAKILTQEPRDPGMSKSLHLTCISLNLLAATGNICPSQHEIDCLEAMLKKFSKRSKLKEVLDIFRKRKVYFRQFEGYYEI